MISRFEPSSRIAFVRVNRLRTIHYDVHLTGENDGSTTLRWEQTITALDDDGDRYVTALREEDFVRFIETMEQMLEHYLTTGEALDVGYG